MPAGFATLSVVLAVLVVALDVSRPVSTYALDAADCHSALEELRDAADSAADDAERAERECRDCEDCRDLEEDDCDLPCDECSDSKARVRSELSSVESALMSVRSGCDYAFELDPAKALEKARRRLEGISR